MIDDTVQLLKALADQSRLKIIASLHKEPMYVELLAERLELHPSTVSFHLKKLEKLGIINSSKEQYYVIYSLNKDKLNINIMQLISNISLASQTQEEKEQEYNDKIIHTFFKDGKLTSIPVQRKKRNIILHELAKEFEIGKEYTEKEVNLILSDYHFDFCTLRREFIMNKMFTRENGIYVRII